MVLCKNFIRLLEIVVVVVVHKTDTISYANDLERVKFSFASDRWNISLYISLMCVSPGSVTVNVYILSWMKPNVSRDNNSYQ